VLAVGTDRQFATLCQELGQPELAEDRRFATNAARVTHHDELLERLAEALAAAPAAEWIGRLSARGVPCGPINRMDEALALAEQLGLDPVVEQRDQAGRLTRSVRHPVSYSESSPTYRSAPAAWEDVEPISSLAPLLEDGPAG
jgi:crotonobetainyl-CoA:carnitine CoA-transferase CaiB-like acyl-CoA transferase